MNAPEEHPDYCGQVIAWEGEPFILVCPKHLDEYTVTPLPYTETGGKVPTRGDRDRIREILNREENK